MKCMEWKMYNVSMEHVQNGKCIMYDVSINMYKIWKISWNRWNVSMDGWKIVEFIIIIMEYITECDIMENYGIWWNI